MRTEQGLWPGGPFAVSEAPGRMGAGETAGAGVLGEAEGGSAQLPLHLGTRSVLPVQPALPHHRCEPLWTEGTGVLLPVESGAPGLKSQEGGLGIWHSS